MNILTLLAITIITAAIYFLFWLASLFIKSQSCYKTTNIEEEQKEQNFNIIKKQLDIWDRWGFDDKNNLFIGFTLHDIFEDGSQGFKPKLWIKGNKETFNKLMTLEIPKRNYTDETNYFIESK